MGINLGFESLGYGDFDDSVYSQMENLVTFNQIGSDLLDTCYELNNVLRTYETVCAIQKCIRRYGVTRSLEALYGENYNGVASMEDDNAQAKEGLWKKIVHFFEIIWQKIVDFWNWLTMKAKRAMSALKNAEYKAPFDISLTQETLNILASGTQSKNGGAVNAKLSGSLENGKYPVRDANTFNADKKSLLEGYDKATQAVTNLRSELKELKNTLKQSKPEDAKQQLSVKNRMVQDAVRFSKAIVNVAAALAAGAKKAGKKAAKGGDANAQGGDQGGAQPNTAYRYSRFAW